MSINKVYTFAKEEHLCRLAYIEQLFSGQAETFMVWPVRMICLLVGKKSESDAATQVMVSVSKRYFKHAVDRNRVKRQLRESFRLNRLDLMEWLQQHPQKQLWVAFVWQDEKLHDSADVKKAIVKLLGQLTDRLTPEGILKPKNKKSKS